MVAGVIDGPAPGWRQRPLAHLRTRSTSQKSRAMQDTLARFGRREVLGGLLGLAGTTVARGAPAAWRNLPEIRPVPTRRPEPGLVELTLDAAPARLTVAGRQAELWTYGGGFPGRLLRVREGETLRLRFANRLPEPTNLHFHGLHIPPTGRADNTWLRIPPGETFRYEFTVPEGAGGTHWYHPHVHGTIARQMWAGLAGPLIVDGPLDAMPELAAADERIVVLKDLALDGDRPAPHRVMDWHKGKQGDLVLVNGVPAPRLHARAGTVRLRLINAANARYFRLGLAEERPWHLIATDGHFLARPESLDDLLLVPGARADVLIPFEDQREIRLRQLFYDRRAPEFTPEQTLLTIVPPPLARPLPLPEQLAAFPELRAEEAATRRRITMAMFLLNGQPFNPNRIDIAGQLGDLELWEVENVGTMDHPFHIHTWYFQVLSRNGKSEARRAWYDTVNLRPGDRLELLVPLRSYVGKTVYHCHVAEHGDKGMMGVVEVR